MCTYMNLRTGVIVSSIVALLVVALVFYYNYRVTAATPVRDWGTEIRTYGATQAYRMLLTRYAHASNSDQHREGHAFGHALYDALGVSGFPVCGTEFEGGCIHEFVGTAIHAEGTGVVQAFDAACIEKYGPLKAVTCQHGFGHGLVSYFGYTHKGLEDALHICSGLEEVSPVQGCLGGSFMEFNSRTMANGKQRALDKEHPFALCESIEDEYKPACYFWSTQWLMIALYEKNFNEQTFRDVGGYCARLSDEYAVSCYRGLGYFAPPSVEFNRERARALCDAVSTDATYQKYCWEIAKQTSH